jgi:hypothetical protein
MCHKHVVPYNTLVEADIKWTAGNANYHYLLRRLITRQYELDCCDVVESDYNLRVTPVDRLGFKVMTRGIFVKRQPPQHVCVWSTRPLSVYNYTYFMIILAH